MLFSMMTLLHICGSFITLGMLARRCQLAPVPRFAHPALSTVSGGGLTLLPLLVSLLHGHKGREMRLIVGENQRRAVAPVGRHLQGQVNPSERDRGEGCGHK